MRIVARMDVYGGAMRQVSVECLLPRDLARLYITLARWHDFLLPGNKARSLRLSLEMVAEAMEHRPVSAWAGFAHGQIEVRVVDRGAAGGSVIPPLQTAGQRRDGNGARAGVPVPRNGGGLLDSPDIKRIGPAGTARGQGQ